MIAFVCSQDRIAKIHAAYTAGVPVLDLSAEEKDWHV
jgi:hypothetical protein